MTDLDRASLDRILPSTPGLADWEDVMSRSRAGRSRRRWPLVVLAAVILVAGLLVTPAFGIGGRLLDLIQGTPRPPEVAGTPAWSPDGRMIAFNSLSHDDLGGGYDVHAMNADGSGQRRLARNASAYARSPVGRAIAFSSRRDGNRGIYVINADDGGQRRLTRTLAGETALAWSPDGRKLAFDRNGDIYVMNADGSGQVAPPLRSAPCAISSSARPRARGSLSRASATAVSTFTS